MDKLEAPFRRGQPDDAPVLAELINYAGEGMALHLWTGMASPGQSGWDVGVARARLETGSFSYRNAIMIEADGAPAGCMSASVIKRRPSAQWSRTAGRSRAATGC